MKTKYSDEELAKIQIEKEIAMKTAGVDRFNMNNDRAISEGSNSETQWNRRIIQTLITPMADSIQAYLDYYSGRRGKPSKTLSYLKLIDNKQAAYITIKNILDSLTRETETRAAAKIIGQRIEDQVRFAGVQNSAPRYIEKVQKALRQANSKKYKHKQAVLAHAEGSLVKGNKKRKIAPKPELKWKAWPENELVQLGSKLIDIFAENVLFEGQPVIEKLVVQSIACRRDSKRAYLVATKHINGWIERYKEVIEVMSPAFAPCVVPPRDWKTPTCGGYHIPEVAETLPMVKCRKSQRNKLTKKQMPAVYEALNTLQSVAWQIEDRTLEVAKQCLRLGNGLGMPQSEPYIIPEAPVPEEYRDLRGDDLKQALTEEQWVEFLNWKGESKKLYALDKKRQADYVKVSRVLGSASQYQEFERIFFVYTLDFRGRVYCKSDSASPQGDDLQKGLIRFADGMALGPNGYKWLAVQGANVWGEDKCIFEDRVKFIEGMNEQIRDIACDPLTFTEWAAADKPWQFLNWCFEWADLLDWIEGGNKEEDFVSHLPVAMDGSCSGIQHYSAILRDPSAGAAVNLLPDDHPHDIYGDVAKVAELVFKEMQEIGSDDYPDYGDSEEIKKIAAGWLSVYNGINRNLCKSPVMTLPYGSTQIRCLANVGLYLTELQSKEDKKAKAQGREPLKVHPFVEPGQEGVDRFTAEKLCSSVIWKAIGEIIVGPRVCMKFIQNVAAVVAKEDSHVEFETPTGFIVEVREYDYSSKRIKTQLMGETYFTLKEEKSTFNIRKMKSSSAPNFIHAMDASHLTLAVNAFKRVGINSIAVIHDSFGTYAGQTDLLRRELISSFVNMYKENDVLKDFLDYNEGLIFKEIEVPIPEHLGLDLEEVRKSTYIFA